MTLDWPSWLDGLEASITAQRAALAEGRHDDVAVAVADPPLGLGPLPAGLRSRAQELLHLNTSFTAELATTCAAHARQLRLLASAQPDGAGPSFVDTRT